MSLRSRKASSFSFVAHHDADFCLPGGYVKPHLFDQTTKRQRFQIPFCYRDGGRVTVGGTASCPDSERGGCNFAAVALAIRALWHHVVQKDVEEQPSNVKRTRSVRQAASPGESVAPPL
jgi:hypothetical protein